MSVWPYFWRLARANLGLYAVTAVAFTGALGLPVVAALLLRELFDSLTGEAALEISVWTILALKIGVDAFHLAVVQTASQISEDVLGSMLETRLQTNLFKGVVEGRPRQGGPSAGDAINRFRDDVRAIVEPLTVPPFLVGYVVVMAATFYVMYQVSPLVASVVFLPSVAVVVVTRALRGWVRAYREAARGATSRMSGSLGELLGAVQAIQVGNAESDAVEHFDRLGERRRKASLKEAVLNAGIGSFGQSTLTLTIGVLLLSAAHLTIEGSFTLGDFALLVGVVQAGYIAHFPTLLGEQIANLQRARISFRRMAELVDEDAAQDLVRNDPLRLRGPLDEVPRAAKTDAHRLDSLRVDGLTSTHPETGRGISEISLHVPRGSFTVITGRVGSGKTTLLRAMLGLVPADGGDVLWNGERVEDPRTFLVPPRCAYTPQVPRLFSDTLSEQHPHGPAGERGRPGRGRPTRRHGTGHRAARERARHARRAAGCTTLRRPGAADGRSPYVRAGSRNCSSSTTCRARSTWRPSVSSGSGCSSCPTRRRWSCPTGAPPTAAPTTSSC